MIEKEIVIILAEDDLGHAHLIMKNLKRAGISNTFLHFKDGQEALEFLHNHGSGPKRKRGEHFVLLLDIKMPKIDGIGVLRQIKQNSELRKIPVFMVTASDDPLQVERCHRLGCSVYITKPAEYEGFKEAIWTLGLFLKVVQTPMINGLLSEA